MLLLHECNKHLLKRGKDDELHKESKNRLTRSMLFIKNIIVCSGLVQQIEILVQI